jgi:hypothetical protein
LPRNGESLGQGKSGKNLGRGIFFIPLPRDAFVVTGDQADDRPNSKQVSPRAKNKLEPMGRLLDE